MDIFKVIGIGLVSLFIIVIIKQYKPELAIYISLVAGIIILSISFEALEKIINLIENCSEKIPGCSRFVIILLKITGIAILSELARKRMQRLW